MTLPIHPDMPLEEYGKRVKRLEDKIVRKNSEVGHSIVELCNFCKFEDGHSLSCPYYKGYHDALWTDMMRVLEKRTKKVK